jgi:hypothetical protein
VAKLSLADMTVSVTKVDILARRNLFAVDILKIIVAGDAVVALHVSMLLAGISVVKPVACALNLSWRRRSPLKPHN